MMTAPFRSVLSSQHTSDLPQAESWVHNCVGGPMSDYVLIIEDDDSVARALALLLDDYGFESKVVSNGREALAFLQLASMPSLILLDLMMPVMSGEEFIDIKKNDPVLAKIPVCILTAFDRALSEREDIAARLQKARRLEVRGIDRRAPLSRMA